MPVNKIKKLLFLFVVLNTSVLSVINAQQLPIYTQYKLNAHVFNPAISGAHGWTTVNVTAREQWLGLSGAPNTYTLSAEYRLLKQRSNISSGLFGMKKLQKSRTGRVGLGGVVFSDYNGAISQTGVKLSYAYHIELYESQLSLGAGVILEQLKVDKTKLDFGDDDPDPIFLNGSFMETAFAPDATIGVYYLAKQFFFGLSANYLFQSPLRVGSDWQFGKDNSQKISRHYYINGGYEFYLNRDFELEPSVLIKLAEPSTQVSGFGNRLTAIEGQFDLNVKLMFRDDYWGGISYRFSPGESVDGDLIAIVGVRYNQFFFAYSFDYVLSNIQNYSFGTHEISIGFRFGASDQKFRWRDRY